MADRPDDMMAQGMEAALEAKARAIDTIREVRGTLVNSQAWGRELTKTERIARHRQFLDSPDQMEMEWQNLEARFKRSGVAGIPRRFLEYGLLIARDLREERTNHE